MPPPLPYFPVGIAHGKEGLLTWLVLFVALPQVALRANPATLTLQNDGDEMISAATALHLKVC